MNIEKSLAKLFRLNDENWLKHANPLSVYSRYAVLPFLSLPILFRVELGVYWNVLLVLALVWMYINPIFFKKPKSTRNWASRCVMGERIYLKRKELSLPEHLDTPVYTIANLFAGVGFFSSFYAAYKFDWKLLVMATLLTIVAKTWFLDRMVWLFLETKDLNEEFSSWDF